MSILIWPFATPKKILILSVVMRGNRDSTQAANAPVTVVN